MIFYQRLEQRQIQRVALLAAPPFLATALLWLTRGEPISLTQGLASLFLLCIPWWSYQRWLSQERGGTPLFPVISFAYWLYFGFPLFWGEHSVRMWQLMDVWLTDEAITKALLMAVFGVVCIWLGISSSIGRSLVPNGTIDIAPGAYSFHFLRLVLVAGILFRAFDSTPYLLGSGGRQLLLILQTTVPMAVFALFFRKFLLGNLPQPDTILIALFMFLQVLLALSSGWLGSLALLIVVMGVVYIQAKRTVPVWAVLLVLLSFLFFQAGKQDFRQEYWNRGNAETQTSRIDRVTFWLERSVETWAAAFRDPTGQALRETAFRSLSRVSLLPQTANVLELTPEVIPHQGAQMYSFLAVTLIPRFLWPNKPSVNEANRLYQVSYGLTREENLESVSISVGALTESYIGFGWWGILAVMFLIGILLDFVQHLLLSDKSGYILQSLGAVLIFQFLAIEAQLGQYIGGLVQQVILTLVVLAPVLRSVSWTRARQNTPSCGNRDAIPQC